MEGAEDLRIIELSLSFLWKRKVWMLDCEESSECFVLARENVIDQL